MKFCKVLEVEGRQGVVHAARVNDTRFQILIATRNPDGEMVC
jgi:hypothetical protein